MECDPVLIVAKKYGISDVLYENIASDNDHTIVDKMIVDSCL